MENLGRAEYVTVRRVGKSYQAEARNGAWWAVGEILCLPDHATQSAIAKLEAELPTKPSMFEDILG